MSLSPGPWEYDENTRDTDPAFIRSPKRGAIVAEVFGIGFAERRANARLLTASLDLLAVCERIRAEQDEQDSGRPKLSVGADNALRFAIAKARGE